MSYAGFGSGFMVRDSQREERSNMASNHTESWYSSLLGIAENFRTSNPPNIKLCIHCLQSIFNFKPPPRIEARTHLQIATVMVTHTKNITLAEKHLEKSVSTANTAYMWIILLNVIYELWLILPLCLFQWIMAQSVSFYHPFPGFY